MKSFRSLTYPVTYFFFEERLYKVDYGINERWNVYDMHFLQFNRIGFLIEQKKVFLLTSCNNNIF